MTRLIELYGVVNVMLTGLIHHLSIFHFFDIHVLTISHAISLCKIWDSSLNHWSILQATLLTTANANVSGVLLLIRTDYLALADTSSLVSDPDLTLIVDALGDLGTGPKLSIRM